MVSSELYTLLPATELHLSGITSIYNEAILNTVATFDTEPKTTDDRRIWLQQHNNKYPVYVALFDKEVVGWASLSRWSDRCAYDNTAEISVYISQAHQGKGLGKKLMQAVLNQGHANGLHTVLSRITEGNDISIRLHEQLGFTNIGVL
jgi:phosphinothricin acetyltransferase